MYMKYDILEGVRFVGDLSLQDACVLVEYGRKSKNILEFGAGGSTQIFAQCMPTRLVTVETDPRWIDRTMSRVAMLDKKTEPAFVPFDYYPTNFAADLIFVDGASELRGKFCLNTWDQLKVGGVMIFHDTRRPEYFQHVLNLSHTFFNEIGRIDVNVNQSNMTVVHKGPRLSYVDWNQTESKPAWAYGNAEHPEKDTLWQIND
jgi:hypothetical protein